jgi:hypothetical protein
MQTQTFDDVFAAFGGPARFGEATGIAPNHAQTMKSRGSIPPAYWPKVVGAAKSKRLGWITFEKLAEMAAQKLERASA